MKKRVYLLIITAMLMILTACGFGETQEESGTGAGREIAEAGSETDEKEPGTEEIQKSAESAENAAPAEHKYEKMTVSYSEGLEGFSFRRDMEKTQTEYAVYYFDSSIDNQERKACIETTDKRLSCIDAAQPAPEIVVLTEEFYDGISVSGNRLYLSPQPWDSADYLAKVLLAGYGEWGNYGLAYGYADYLCKKAGADSGDTGPDGQEAKGFLPMSASELYDLNLLCFHEKFVSAKDVEASKNNACLFVEEYLSSHSEAELLELLSASGTAEGAVRAKEALEAFYAEKGVECRLSEIRYQPGGSAFDYVAACQYARFYIKKDWQDANWEANPMVSENFLHEDYEEVRAFFECNEHQMEQYQELFGFDNYNNDLPVIMKKSRGVTETSAYGAHSHVIYLTRVDSLMHEYIHSLMWGHCDWESLWKREGVARYFSYKYNQYSYDFLNNDWNRASKIWVQEYIDFLGRPIDVRTDFPELWNIIVHSYSFIDPNSSYESGASFIGYLIKQYREQEVIAYICSDNEYNTEWGKSYEELVQDWNQFIEDNYSQYKRNGNR